LYDYFQICGIYTGIWYMEKWIELNWIEWGRGEVYTGIWWRNRSERDHLEDPGIDGRIILRWIFRKWDVGTWPGSVWLRTGTGGRHLWML